MTIATVSVATVLVGQQRLPAGHHVVCLGAATSRPGQSLQRAAPMIHEAVIAVSLKLQVVGNMLMAFAGRQSRWLPSLRLQQGLH